MKYTSVLTLSLLFFIINEGVAQTPRLAIHSYAIRAAKKAPKKSRYTMDQFIGRWQETESMTSTTKEKVAVVDTLCIRFFKDNTATTKEGDNALVVVGTSALYMSRKDDYITTSAIDFKIVSVSPNVIVLDDLNGHQHSLSRTDLFTYEIIKTPPVASPVIADNKVDLSPSSLIKNWFKYKGIASPGFITNESQLLQNLSIQEKVSENSYKGEVQFGARNGKAYVQPCTLVFNDRMVTINTEGNTWNMEVYKADGQEMILGKKGEMVYYFK